MKSSFGEKVFKSQCKRSLKIKPVYEYLFHKPEEGKKRRLWRFDFAWPELMIAVEIEGGTYSVKKSRHTTGKGFDADCIKYNCATEQGWRVFRYSTKQVMDSVAINQIKRLIAHE